MSQKSSYMKPLFFIVMLAAAALGIRYVSASQAAGNAPAASPQPAGIIKYPANAPQLSSLKVEQVKQTPLPVSESLNGRVAYDENLTTRISSPIAGRITAVRAEIGDTVQPNAVLAMIDAPDLAAAEADWQKAGTEEIRKKKALDRAQLLLDGEVLARKDFENAEADYLQAKAETRRASLRLKNLHASGVQDGKFGLRTAIGGIVTDRQVNPGQEVRPDLPNPLFVVTDPRHLWVLIDAPERSAKEIHPGQLASIEVDAYPDEKFSAKVDRVGIALDSVTRRMQVRCKVDNADGKLKPEMFARVSFLANDGSGQAISLPNTSLFSDGMYSYVFVETAPGTFEKRRVSVKLKGADHSFISEGLAAGERVVTEGAFLLNAEVAGNAQ